MKAGNHIAGGFVFTGFFASLYNVNILENWKTITIVIFFSLFPDIDHTKSIIGKLFYPISRFIARYYGHRTITHSLLFLISVWGVSKFLDVVFNMNYSLLILFALTSHLVLDMITVVGVPLFYPFKKNPCVIPANKNMRIRTGDPRSEGIAFLIFALLALFLNDLFKDGFWTNYNKQFTDVEHIYREYKSHNNVINIEYDYKYFDSLIIGTGQLLNTTYNDLTLYNKHNKIVHITNDPNTHINSLVIDKLEVERHILKLSNSLNLEDLNDFCNGKYFTVLDLYCDEKITMKGKSNNWHNLKNIYSPKFTYNNRDEDVLLKKQELKLVNNNRAIILQKKTLKKEVSNLKAKLLLEISNFEKEQTIKEIIFKNKEIDKIKIVKNQAVKPKKFKEIKINVNGNYIEIL